MTDDYKYPSNLRVIINGKVIGSFYLEDDPADHREFFHGTHRKETISLMRLVPMVTL
jgi:hypothetical protein